MDTVQLLKAARARIEHEEDWTTGQYGPRHGPNCAVGALKWEGLGPVRKLTYRSVNRVTPDPVAVEYLCRALPTVVPVFSRTLDVWAGEGSIIGFNDVFCSHRMVLALFDRAIALAEADQPIFDSLDASEFISAREEDLATAGD